MRAALKKLIEALDGIVMMHGELLDTDVCEALADALANAFIFQTPGYVVPTTFGMFTPDADALVYAAFLEFLDAVQSAGRTSNAQQRRHAFQDSSVVTHSGRTYRDYFGHVESDDDFLKAQLRDAEFGFKPDKRNRP